MKSKILPEPSHDKDWGSFLWALGIYAFGVAAFFALVVYIS